MSHFHLEIIMPPVEDVKEAVRQIMNPFREYGQDEDGVPNSHPFFEWYVIGGRWDGAKSEALLDTEKRKQFCEELAKRKITVAAAQFWKPTLDPSSQIPMVNKPWRKFFPESPLKVCPLFSHFKDQYKDNDGPPNVMRLKDVSMSTKAARVIIAGPQFENGGVLEAEYMTQDSTWNGVTYVNSAWDGTIGAAIKEHKAHTEGYTPKYLAKYIPRDDWLCVTVDYRS